MNAFTRVSARWKQSTKTEIIAGVTTFLATMYIIDALAILSFFV